MSIRISSKSFLPTSVNVMDAPSQDYFQHRLVSLYYRDDASTLSHSIFVGFSHQCRPTGWNKKWFMLNVVVPPHGSKGIPA
jgi:hypothetical protein